MPNFAIEPHLNNIIPDFDTLNREIQATLEHQKKEQEKKDFHEWIFSELQLEKESQDQLHFFLMLSETIKKQEESNEKEIELKLMQQLQDIMAQNEALYKQEANTIHALLQAQENHQMIDALLTQTRQAVDHLDDQLSASRLHFKADITKTFMQKDLADFAKDAFKLDIEHLEDKKVQAELIKSKEAAQRNVAEILSERESLPKVIQRVENFNLNVTPPKEQISQQFMNNTAIIMVGNMRHFFEKLISESKKAALLPSDSPLTGIKLANAYYKNQVSHDKIASYHKQLETLSDMSDKKKVLEDMLSTLQNFVPSHKNRR
jgi:hypothetical protein